MKTVTFLEALKANETKRVRDSEKTIWFEVGGLLNSIHKVKFLNSLKWEIEEPKPEPRVIYVNEYEDSFKGKELGFDWYSDKDAAASGEPSTYHRTIKFIEVIEEE